MHLYLIKTVIFFILLLYLFIYFATSKFQSNTKQKLIIKLIIITV